MLAVLVGDKMKYKKILKIFNNKSKNKNAISIVKKEVMSLDLKG